ncbi:MAG: hypothetical protein ORN83_13000 [Chthoniobacteraceae bacterium]|nr:hypothetical protein [Chthoniobacteraceae bacterium]
MVAARDNLPIKDPFGQRYTSVGAIVPKCEWLPCAVSAKYDLFPEDRALQKFPLL